MFRFADPFYLLLILPVTVALWFVYRRRVRAGLAFAALYRVPPSNTTWRILLSSAVPALVILGITFSILALARPQTVFSKIRKTSDVIAIEMVVDCSGSMNALDMSIQSPTGTKMRTRLDAVKDAFADFVSRRQDDLLGLVTFGGYATSRAPLTLDHDAILAVLKGVQVINASDGTQEEQLTAIGDALATACARLEGSEPRSKIIVLLTDGDSNTGVIQPEEAAKVAKRMGIKVYTIGIGSNGNAPFKARDMFGREVIANFRVTMDEELLRKIASMTGGKYFNVRDAKGMDKVMEEINKLEKTKIERAVYSQYNELFPWFLAPGLALVILGTSMNMLVARRLL